MEDTVNTNMTKNTLKGIVQPFELGARLDSFDPLASYKKKFYDKISREEKKIILVASGFLR
jgi:hypothetical protein